ncbi:MAG TPA: matrixin family metalloprotease [Dehalococcoidia bacterium]|nr:matrixin family metalloprotease [Dehalococcoidia bacterium]
MLALVFALGWLAGGADRALGDGGGSVPYDRGVVLVREGSPHDSAVPLTIDFFTDDFGPPPGRWAADGMPVEFCTFQFNRPSTVTAEQFRESIELAIRVWSDAEAAIGLRYSGDCPTSFRYEFTNGRNEIGFDDNRAVVTDTQAGQTLGQWSEPFGSVDRNFTEMDIVLDEQARADVPLQCFQTTIKHEMGHALGLGHSDVSGDLMFASFDPTDVSTCPDGPSLSEQQRVQELYGIDRAPTVTLGSGLTTDVGTMVILNASGSDPEGKPLTYEWVQLSGPTVALDAIGSSVSFVAPQTTGVTLVFEVTVFDPFFHRGTATESVDVAVAVADGPPAQAPALISFLPSSEGNALIGWRPVTGASSYQLCGASTLVPDMVTCSDHELASAPVDWDLTLGTKGVASDRRVLTTGVRETSMKACNSLGCSAVGTGPLAGGLRWPAWDIDYDFFALGIDAGPTKWTIFGAVNVAGAKRSFDFYIGPPDDPLRTRVRRCGVLFPGAVCIAVLFPADAHAEVVTIVSSVSEAPTVEHRIPVR